MAVVVPNRKILTPGKILESVRELAYDLEHSQNDDEFSDLIHEYFTNYQFPHQRDWESIDPKFKPGVLIDELVRQWGDRIKAASKQIKKDMKELNFWKK